MIREEEVRCDNGAGSRRRKGWSLVDRRLLEVLGSRVFHEGFDFFDLIPPDLPDPFSTEDLGSCIDRPRWLARKMALFSQYGPDRNCGEKGKCLSLFDFIKKPFNT